MKISLNLGPNELLCKRSVEVYGLRLRLEIGKDHLWIEFD